VTNYIEPTEKLSTEAKDFVRALHSLKEEVEAVIWYHQRIDITDDDALKEILKHNRDEEIEHVCMVLEWLRRNMPGWEEEMQENLFTEGPIGHSEEINIDNNQKPVNPGSLNLGSMKK
jgi:uncharacterized protein